MAPGPRSRRSRELDDDLLLRIFSKVGCARELARFALVCKRWRDLSYAVSHISFSLRGLAVAKGLRAKEGVISSVLCRASIRAPGSLKHLEVSIFSGDDGEVHAHWLLTVTSLTKLELIAVVCNIEWGPAVWNAVLRMEHLEELSIAGNVSTEKHLLLPQVLATGLQMTRLQKCIITNNSNILLETILAICPALAELEVECEKGLAEEVLRVASNSLKIFSMVLHDSDLILEASIHAPSLTTLELLGIESSSIHFESAQSLQTLFIQSSYELYNVPNNLQELKLERICDLRRLPEMLVHTPMITDLWLMGVSAESDERIDIDHILAPLVNLRNIYLYSGTMRHLQAGKRTFDSLTVHLRAYSRSRPNVCFLKGLIEVHKVQSLMVHSTDMMDYQRKTINKGYAKWRFLFELSHFYPDRIKFV